MRAAFAAPRQPSMAAMESIPARKERGAYDRRRQGACGAIDTKAHVEENAMMVEYERIEEIIQEAQTLLLAGDDLMLSRWRDSLPYEEARIAVIYLGSLEAARYRLDSAVRRFKQALVQGLPRWMAEFFKEWADR